MRSMVPSDLCAAEDAVLILLDHLVDPLLPARFVRDTPSQSLQKSVAKQVHAVVLLYNYYHRKQHQQLKFEGFESFCKLAVAQKPTLLAHVKLMQRSNDSALDDLEKQLSVTEKAIMDACDISNSLDTSKDVPRTEGWPISKVAVLLIDSTNENCYLKYGSMTQGVWSLIEKDVDVSSCISEGEREGKHKRKKIKVTRGDGVDEVSFKQVAFSAVTEAAGVNQSSLAIIGSDVAYSLSKEKTMAKFYMMQCEEPPKNDYVTEVPIKDVIDSLQGPLVMKSSGQWIATKVVEHFHLLPYAGFMSDWLYREVLPSCFEDQRLKLGSINMSKSNRTEEPCKQDIHDNQDRSRVKSNICIGNSADKNSKSPIPTDKTGCDLNGTAGSNTKVEMAGSRRIPCITECRGEHAPNLKATSCTICSDEYEKPIGDFALSTDQSYSKDTERQQNSVTSKEKRTKTALDFFRSRRNKLTLYQCKLKDEIAVCDKRIQTILNGDDDDLGLNLESLEEDSNDICRGSLAHERIHIQFENQSSSQSIEMKRLSEAVLVKKNSCEELDGICNKKNWLLPTYRVSPSDGGF